MGLAVVEKAVRLLLLGAATLGVTGGCSGGGGGEGPDGAAELSWCQARAVLEAKCQRCHFGSPGAYGASFPLLTYEDTQLVAAGGKLRWIRMQEAVSLDYMPPNFLPDAMPPVQPLSASEKQTLLAWFDQGALATGGVDCD